MIFADKLIQLRKKAGWSQEELAELMNVTRQSVSKWEGMQSVPDLEKIIRLSELFGVSTDYLLKDSIEDIDVGIVSNDDYSEGSTLRRVSMEEANAFLSIKAKTAKPIALATLLCILSPICLLILVAISEFSKYGISENVAVGVGMIVLLVFVTIAVTIFIMNGRKTEAYSYLEKEVFETEYGVSGMVAECKSKYNNTYTRNNIIGVVLCIMAVIPLFVGVFFKEENMLLQVSMLCVTLIIIGIGVVFFVTSGIIWASYEKLLQEGEYLREKKKKKSIVSAISSVYWLIATAIFLGYSFATDNWKNSWIIWVVAGLVYPAVIIITNYIENKK